MQTITLRGWQLLPLSLRGGAARLPHVCEGARPLVLQLAPGGRTHPCCSRMVFDKAPPAALASVPVMSGAMKETGQCACTCVHECVYACVCARVCVHVPG